MTSFQKCILLFCYSVLVMADQNQSMEFNYHWGRGLKIPEANLTFGGYAHFSYENFEHQSDKAGIDDLSLFITWDPTSRLHLFSELEFEDAVSTDGTEFSQKTFFVERLYADFLINDSFSLRFGKFLTPVGIWNTIHAAPLVWTTTRPLITEEFIFPAHSNGLMLNSHLILNDQNLEISLYADNSQHLDPHKKDISFKNALGLRINYEFMDHLHFGFSYLAFKNQAKFYPTDRNHLFGIDLIWKRKGVEIQGEFIHRRAPEQRGNETGLYLQAVLPLGHHFSAVGRYEFLEGAHQKKNILENSTIHLGIAGLAWRPYSPMVFKVEYRFGGDDSIIVQDGFFASFSTFF